MSLKTCVTFRLRTLKIVSLQLYISLSARTTRTGRLPVFTDTPTNVTTSRGSVAVMRCGVDNLGTKTVSWCMLSYIYRLEAEDFILLHITTFYDLCNVTKCKFYYKWWHAHSRAKTSNDKIKATCSILRVETVDTIKCKSRTSGNAMATRKLISFYNYYGKTTYLKLLPVMKLFLTININKH